MRVNHATTPAEAGQMPSFPMWELQAIVFLATMAPPRQVNLPDTSAAAMRVKPAIR